MQATGTANDTENASSSEAPGGTVAFKVMLRRGGKDDKTRSVQVLALNSPQPITLSPAYLPGCCGCRHLSPHIPNAFL
jgi:hypothetical protein